MPDPTALSPVVHAYLAGIRGVPGFFVGFLSSDDFKIMQEIAKDFGGIEIKLPGASCRVDLNVFGVLTFKPENGSSYNITCMGPDEDEQRYLSRAREFICGLREWVFPGWDSFGCSETLIQACYDSISATIDRAISGKPQAGG